MSNPIEDALQKLDVNNDNHWTADGLPRIETVRMLAGNQALTRDAIAAAVPGFCRAVAAGGATVQGTQAQAPQPASQPQQIEGLPVVADAGKTEQPTMEDTSELEAAIAEAEALVAVKAEVLSVATTEHNEALQALDALLLKRSPDGHKHDKIETALTGYFERARLEREAAAKSVGEIAELTKKVDDLRNKTVAPIDRAGR